VKKRTFLKAVSLSLCLSFYLRVEKSVGQQYPNKEHPFNFLINALESIEKSVCLNAAEELTRKNRDSKTYDLHLRNASLSRQDVNQITAAIAKTEKQSAVRLSSLSLSYNPTIPADGFISMLNALPTDIDELGLVGCNLNDNVGRRLAKFLLRTTQLQMVCVEDNLFSALLKQKIVHSTRHLLNCTVIV
jgi:hypothetical protein